MPEKSSLISRRSLSESIAVDRLAPLRANRFSRQTFLNRGSQSSSKVILKADSGFLWKSHVKSYFIVGGFVTGPPDHSDLLRLNLLPAARTLAAQQSEKVESRLSGQL